MADFIFRSDIPSLETKIPDMELVNIVQWEAAVSVLNNCVNMKTDTMKNKLLCM